MELLNTIGSLSALADAFLKSSSVRYAYVKEVEYQITTAPRAPSSRFFSEKLADNRKCSEMDVFEFREKLVADYAAFTHSFTRIRAADISSFVDKAYNSGRYTDADLAFIIPRVLELTYTAHDLKPLAVDLGYDGAPFPWNPTRRAQLRAKLDAYYARLYGLSRDELRYILDPADVMSEDYPSETFRVLKNNEIREFEEYSTRRLALEAWDAMERDWTARAAT